MALHCCKPFAVKARSLGAKFWKDEVSGLVVDHGRVERLHLKGAKEIQCGIVVNAAGPFAGIVAKMAGVKLPVFPEEHSIFVFECADGPHQSPLVIDPDGVYFRPEGVVFIAAA